MNEAKGMIGSAKNFVGKEGKGRAFLKAGTDKAAAVGGKVVDKVVEKSQEGAEKARDAARERLEVIQAKRGQQANETISAVDGLRDQMTVLATADPEVLAPAPIDLVDPMEDPDFRAIEHNAQQRFIEHEVGVNQANQTLTDEQKTILLRDMRASEVDRFVVEHPDKAEIYKDDPSVRAALERRDEQSRETSNLPEKPTSLDEWEKALQDELLNNPDLSAGYESAVRDPRVMELRAEYDAGPHNSEIRQQLLDQLNTYHPDLGDFIVNKQRPLDLERSADDTAEDTTVEAAPISDTADPTDPGAAKDGRIITVPMLTTDELSEGAEVGVIEEAAEGEVPGEADTPEARRRLMRRAVSWTRKKLLSKGMAAGVGVVGMIALLIVLWELKALRKAAA